FQAEDGIRDRTVTRVQTCALPILLFQLVAVERGAVGPDRLGRTQQPQRDPLLRQPRGPAAEVGHGLVDDFAGAAAGVVDGVDGEIGRASCRERAWYACDGVRA